MTDKLVLPVVSLDPQTAPIIDTGAIIDPTGTYRYRLHRIWDHDRHPMAWVMLNPSTADASQDDPTIRRCMFFARRCGAGGIIVVNLYALRSKDPSDLLRMARTGIDPVGPDNDANIVEAFQTCDVVVAAWGAHHMAPFRGPKVLRLVPQGVEVSCLGVTKDGMPRHPLYVKGTTELSPIPW